MAPAPGRTPGVAAGTTRRLLLCMEELSSAFARPPPHSKEDIPGEEVVEISNFSSSCSATSWGLTLNKEAMNLSFVTG